MDLIHVALLISSNIVTHLAELNLTNEAIDVVVKLFLVLYVCDKDVHCFINIHEFAYTPGVFETLLFVPDSVQMEEVATLLDENITQPAEPVKNKGGQRSLVEKCPEIVDVTSEFIKQHGFSAQCSRRTDTANFLGVSASPIRDHLYQLTP